MKDQKWEQLKSEMDFSKCRLWEILTQPEKDYVLEHFKADFISLSCIDPAHIKGKGAYIEFKYDKENVVTIYRYFHGLLDTYKDPITRKSITKQEREEWFNRIKSGITENPYFRTRYNQK